MQPVLTKRHWIAIIAITALCIATLCVARLWFTNAKYEALQILPLPQPLVKFQLYGDGSRSFTQKDFRGQWHLVFLGFSHCADICPLELDIMARVLKQLQTAGQVRPRIQGVFVSLDPERDSQAVIDDYLAGFNHSISGEDKLAGAKKLSIIGVRGNHAELLRLVKFFGADYSRSLQLNGVTFNLPAGYAMPLGIEKTSQQDYQVNHSARLYLVNPNGQYIGSFPPPHDAQLIAKDLQMIIKR
jgi:protein SCO1